MIGRSGRAALGAAALLLTAAACSGADRPPTPSTTAPDLGRDEFVTTVVEAMVEAGTAHLTLEAGAGTEQEVRAEGDVRIGDADDPKSNESALTVRDGAAGEVEVRILEGRIYANLGDATDGKFVTAELSDKSSGLVKALGSTLDASVVEQTRRLQEVVTGVRAVGSGPRLDGTATTEHVVTIDPERYRGELDEAARRLDSIDFHFYLGRDRLPRRIEIRLGGSVVRTDASDWGGPVTIEPPSRDEITTDDPFA